MSTLKNIAILLSIGLFAGPLSAHAATEAADKPSFTFKPVLLDSDSNQSATLGIEYEFQGVLLSRDVSGKDADLSIDPDAKISRLLIDYSGAGTIATSADRNPKNFLDFNIAMKGRHSTSNSGTFDVGVLAKYETDQSFDNKQTVIALRGTWGKYGLFAQNDFLAFDLGYGDVDPKEDKERKTTLGVTKLGNYKRVDFEALYMLNTGWQVIETIELNYRRFKEVDAPQAIRTAGIDTHEISAIRFGLPNNLFIAYSQGKLPFDRKDDTVLSVGISYKLF